MLNFFRYPGGKSKLKKDILPIIEILLSGQNIKEIEYNEPFMGGGSIGLEMLKYNFKHFNFNDYDKNLYYLWDSVFNNYEELKKLIEQYDPKVEDFELYKNDLNNNVGSNVELAFKKLVIHQISYSGLGVMAGGPIGGQNQTSKYKVGCRWNAANIIAKINIIRNKKNISITNLSYEHMFKNNGFMYLDPPYYVKGNQLYKHGFTVEQHIDLRDRLTKHDSPWLLSYDDCDEIRELYKNFNIIDFTAKYYITEKNNKTRDKSELLISNRGIT